MKEPLREGESAFTAMLRIQEPGVERKAEVGMLKISLMAVTT